MLACEDVWRCSECGACTEACPMEVDVAGMLGEVRRLQRADRGPRCPERSGADIAARQLGTRRTLNTLTLGLAMAARGFLPQHGGGGRGKLAGPVLYSALMNQIDRRDFFKAAGIGATGLAAATDPDGHSSPSDGKGEAGADRLQHLAAPVHLQEPHGLRRNPRTEEMKKKYGEITMLDFPQFTKDTFPGVTHMDIFSGLFGDVTDDSMYVRVPLMVGAATRTTLEFDPSSASGKAVAGQAGEQDGGHRYHVPAYLQQCAARHLRTGRGEAQGRHRGRQEMAGRRPNSGSEIDAREQRRAEDRSLRRWPRQTIPRTMNWPST